MYSKIGAHEMRNQMTSSTLLEAASDFLAEFTGGYALETGEASGYSEALRKIRGIVLLNLSYLLFSFSFFFMLSLFPVQGRCAFLREATLGGCNKITGRSIVLKPEMQVDKGPGSPQPV